MRTSVSSPKRPCDALENFTNRISEIEALERLLARGELPLPKLSGNPLLVTTAEPHWRFLRRLMGEVLRHADPPARRDQRP